MRAALETVADPEKAGPMARYIKSSMPFYGVQQPTRRPIFREMTTRFPPQTQAEYEAAVRALWTLPHREERYAALFYAGRFKRFVVIDSVPLYEGLIRKGAWWDLVDETVTRCVSPLALRERDRMAPILERWVDDDDLWLRRAAILSQLKHKGETDAQMLFSFCLRRAHEREFFIRKAIGWALREYAKHKPETVRGFTEEHRAQLSPLSYREATKHLAPL